MREMTPDDLKQLAKIRERLAGAKQYLFVVSNAPGRQPGAIAKAEDTVTAIQVELNAFIDGFPGAVGGR